MILAVRMLSLASALAVMLSSNPTPPPSGTTGADTVSALVRKNERYSLYLPNDDTLYFDGNGTPIPEQQRFDLLRDKLTNEPRYKQYSRTEDTGKDYEDGSPIVRILCALYDMEGRTVQDWSEYAYREPFGDFIIRMDSELSRNMMLLDSPDSDYYSALWNLKTGKEAVKGVVQTEKLDENSVLLKAAYGTPPLGVMDMGGETGVFRPFPKEYKEADGWNGHIIAEAQTNSSVNRWVLLTKDYKPLMEKSSEDEKFSLNGMYYGLRGNYLFCRDGGEKTILTMDGKVLYTVPEGEDYDYFDGELVLLRKLTDSVNREWTRRLVRADGTELAVGYDRLEAIYRDEYGSDDPAEGFWGVRRETIDLLDKTGKVIATRTIPHLREVYRMEGCYRFDVLPEGVEVDSDCLSGLLNSKLEIIIPADRYHFITEISGTKPNGEYGRFDLMRCGKTVSGGAMRYDIRDSSGKLLIDNLTAVGEAGENRIAVAKGFSVGVMDWQGSWIGKHSLFNSLDDERQEMF